MLLEASMQESRTCSYTIRSRQMAMHCMHKEQPQVPSLTSGRNLFLKNESKEELEKTLK